MLEQYAPPSILVGPDNKLIHLSQHAGRYMVLPGGPPTASVLKLVREELQLELQASLHEAREKARPVDARPIPVRFNGHPSPVVMHVRPALEPEREGYVLIIFEEREPEDGPAGEAEDNGVPGPKAQRIHELEAQLADARRYTQTIIEEYESTREEMSASSEEMQSTNEELRSTLEELETSNGIGIDPKYFEAIFIPFRRVHRGNYPGSGLGLAMCRRIVERYQGRIMVESAEGRGSVFRFTFPDPGVSA